MEPAKERMDGVESAMQLLRKEMNNYLELCLSAEGEPKRVQESSETDTIRENMICSKEKELEERESKVAAMERVLEERQNALDVKQKILEQRSLDLLDSKDSALAIRESKTHSEVEDLKEKKLEDEIEEKNEGKIMRVNIKIESPIAKPNCAIRTESAEKMKGIQRKRSRKVLEMGESSTEPQASGTARNAQVQDGLSFLLNIMQTHENKDAMTVPAYFVAAYDLSGKNRVILSTDEGDFRLVVKHYDDPRHNISRHVIFRRGWREFYCKNNLSIGMQCLFKVKEHTVDGDASAFSMEVSVLGR